MELSEQEIEARREAALKRLLATPPKPHDAKKGAKKPASKGGPPKSA